MFKTVTMKKMYPAQIVIGRGFVSFIGVDEHLIHLNQQ